ncbi:uncharacterized protein METZ01_LOCUS124006 [marine metagenome]|uniref:Uncharacterized protein n=1 Tax=marine metagenome TaxID=408172 RepID=A0A381Y392_9ZZZZ
MGISVVSNILNVAVSSSTISNGSSIWSAVVVSCAKPN